MAGVVKGVGQPQAALIGVGLISDKGTYATYIGASNYLLGDSLLVGGDAYTSEYKNYSYYLGDQGSSGSSGISSIEIQPFYKSRDLGLSQPSHEATQAWGTQLMFDWDNRDDLRNPTQGSNSNLT